MKRYTFLPVLSLLALLARAGIEPVNLRCEYLPDPMGIDMPDPRFYWQLSSGEPGQMQTAYRILVATSLERLDRDEGDAFDSGQQRGGQNTHIVYAGKALEPATAYCWKVKVWDRDQQESAWSRPAFFTTGLFAERDWQGARWISWRPQEEWAREWWRKKSVEAECLEWGLPSYFGGRMNIWERHHFFDDRPYDPSPLYRKEFEVREKPARATAFISGIGYYELTVNGSRIGDQVLDPGWTNYKRTILYATHDVTAHLREGSNAVGVMLGRGFYGQLAYDHWWFYREDGYVGQPKLICRIRLEYEDGSSEDLVTDGSWKVTGGPVIYDGPHMGEIYDATRELPGWDQPGFNDAGWDAAQPAPSPGGKLTAQLCPPIRRVRSYKPALLRPNGGWRGGYYIDAGTQLAGWIRIRLREAEKGDRILVYFGEHEDPLETGQPGGFQQMGYIARGEPGETAECRFSYKGFRYVKIFGYDGALTEQDVDIVEVHSAVPVAGQFSCSDGVANALHEIAIKSLRYNLHSIPTDCPHREKNGWLGDAVTGMEFGMTNYDLAALMTKFTRDIFDTQDEDGGLSIIAPDNHYNRGKSTLWSSAGVHIPWYMYMYYGDTRLFEQYWEGMLKWIAFSWENNNMRDRDGMFRDVLGDWVTPLPDKNGEKPGGNTTHASMNFYLVLKRLSHMAGILGKKQDQQMLAAQAERVRKGINKWCYEPGKAEYTGLIPYDQYVPVINVNALDYGIVPEEDRKRVEERLIRNIVEEKENHLYGGIFAVHSAYEYLPKNAYADLAYQLLVEPSWPSFGWMVAQGATTLWEGFTDSSSNIHHFMGAYDNFFYRHLAGINFDPAEPGFRKIIFRPNFLAELEHVTASYRSLQGEIKASWEQTAPGVFQYRIRIPPNCRSLVILPDGTRRLAPGDHSLVYRSGQY